VIGWFFFSSITFQDLSFHHIQGRKIFKDMDEEDGEGQRERIRLVLPNAEGFLVNRPKGLWVAGFPAESVNRCFIV
jgi:hypothetical protein